MHYTDSEHLEMNILKFVLYKHDVLGDDFKQEISEVDYIITSINKCQYITPRLLSKIISKPNKHLPKIKELVNLKTETWWLITLVQNDWDTFEFIKCEDVSTNEDNFLRLH